MGATVIDCKAIKEQIKDELIERIAKLKSKGIEPNFAAVLVGNDPASQVYVGHKERNCAELGIKSTTYNMAEESTQSEVIKMIETLNNDPSVHGILVQSPLPPHINFNDVAVAISPKKDVDCFHPYNVGLYNISMDMAVFMPCTPAGIIELLKRCNIPVSGKNCVVLGRSNIVGKPMAALLTSMNGTVTICHSKTENLADICRQADIIVVAIRSKNFLTGDMLKKDAIVIDVGINKSEKSRKLWGDADFESCSAVASMITPVPGGVGELTRIMLMANCVKAAENA
jgi:methylenetetrahydrofolate dehydrogenase (NADP+)/methenyltetrahydrofolate cyclohydrolase